VASQSQTIRKIRQLSRKKQIDKVIKIANSNKNLSKNRSWTVLPWVASILCVVFLYNFVFDQMPGKNNIHIIKSPTEQLEPAQTKALGNTANFIETAQAKGWVKDYIKQANSFTEHPELTCVWDEEGEQTLETYWGHYQTKKLFFTTSGDMTAEENHLTDWLSADEINDIIEIEQPRSQNTTPSPYYVPVLFDNKQYGLSNISFAGNQLSLVYTSKDGFLMVMQIPSENKLAQQDNLEVIRSKKTIFKTFTFQQDNLMITFVGWNKSKQEFLRLKQQFKR